MEQQSREAFSHEDSVDKLKEVSINKILEDKNGKVYLRGILKLWYGLDERGNAVVRRDDDYKMYAELDIKSVHENSVTFFEQNCEKDASKITEKMKFNSNRWSIPGYRIVVDAECDDYVRPDGSVDFQKAN